MAVAYFKKVNGKTKFFIKKAFLEGKIGLESIYKSTSGHDFAYFKKWALTSLKNQYDKLEEEAKGIKESEEVTKSFRFVEAEMKKSFPVGTIRTWKGKKFIKSPDKKWRPYYDETTTGKENSKENLGRRRAILAIARKINALEDGDYKGLYDIIQANKDRFFSTNSDKTKMIELYEAMKEKGAVGSGRFSKPKKKDEVKVEVKTEKVKEKEEEKPKEEEKTENKKEEEKKDKDIIPKDFKEMVIRSKATGRTGVIHPIGKEDVFEGTWLEGSGKGKTLFIDKESILEGYEIISIDGKTEKEEPKKEEKESEKIEKGAWTIEESEAMGKLRSLLPTSNHGWFKYWTSDIGTNEVNLEVGSIDQKDTIKGIIKNNIDCSEKQLLAITTVITDAVINGKCTETKEGAPVSSWNPSPSFNKKFEKNGVIVSVYYPEARCSGRIRSIDTETNKEAFEKAVKDFEAKIDENGEFEGQLWVDAKKEKWSDYLGYMKKAKRMVKTEVTKKEHEYENKQRKKEAEYLLKKMIREPTYENMLDCLEFRKVKHNPLGEKREKPLEDEEIIKNLAHFDGTKGSCASLAFCYAAQKWGYDVIDFRGGGSQEVFSHAAKNILMEMGNKVEKTEGDEAGAELLSRVFKGEAGKQYLLSAGHHCAVVRKNYDGKLQYLELQAEGKAGGWQNFDEYGKKRGKDITTNYGFSQAVLDGLEKRFDTKKDSDSIFNIFDVRQTAKLFDIDAGIKEEKMNDFLNAMGYINTKGDKQKVKTLSEWIHDGMKLL